MINNNDRPEVLIFDHIMKTGGQTLILLLQQHFDHLYKLDSYTHWVTLKKDLSSGKINSNSLAVAGHRAWGVHSYINTNFIYTVLLRDPLSRFISHYNFDIARSIITADTLLSTFIEQHSKALYINHFGNGSLENAINRLTNYYKIIGFTEQYNDYLKLLMNHLGINKLEIKAINRSKNKNITISDSEISKAKDMLASDYEFMKHSRDIANNKNSKQQNRNFEPEIITIEDAYAEEFKLSDYIEKNNTSKTAKSQNLAIANYHFNNGDDELAEKHYELYYKDDNLDPEPLVDFYKQKNMHKYINFTEKLMEKCEIYLTDTQKTYPNIFISRCMSDLFSYYANDDYREDNLYKILKSAKYIDSAWVISAISYFIHKLPPHSKFCSDQEYRQSILDILTKIFNGINSVVIFGTGVASDIAYKTAVFYNLKIIAFIDDFKTGTKHGLPIYELNIFKDNVICPDAILAGPCQNGNIKERISAYNIKVIEIKPKQ
ncbi:MAG: hypothetical protein C0603_09790 [Denitrovibrio sp.]|nr:MAG: hypothetical protein C0603_09790 [Denitrovibrio sp.]